MALFNIIHTFHLVVTTNYIDAITRSLAFRISLFTVPGGLRDYPNLSPSTFIFFFVDSLLQQTKHRNCVLIIENKNLKNKIMNMEYELRDVREALRTEERKFILLNEKLKAKMVMGFY